VDVISRTGIVNLDFADVRAIMQDAGPALVGVGHASGEERALIAARQAISSPLLEAEITGARRILFNVLGSNGLRLDEVTVAADEIRTYADPGATVIFGAGLDKRLGDTIQITVIATGFDLSDEPATASARAVPRLAEKPPTVYAGAADRRAPIDLEAPSYIRRGRRRGDLPLEGPTDRTASTSPAEAPEGTEASADDRQAEPVGERQRRK
jgi:cell division protein FtsZ